MNNIQNKSIDELVLLYKQGHTLYDNPNIYPNADDIIPYSKSGYNFALTPTTQIKSMVDTTTITADVLIVGLISIAVGSLIYYKLGKWEAKKLGWDK